MILIILASGRGSRLGKVTNTKPKCLINIYKNKTLIDYLSEKFELFSKVIVVTGYKSKILKKKLNSKKIIFVENKKYQNTNMVESLMLCKTLINNDLIISYADIFYDGNILRKLNKLKGNFLPVNKNWLNSWKKRYGSLAEIKNDAEDLVTKNKKIISLSGKIKNKIPKYQYMGIIKLTKQSFIKLHNYYKALKNSKISMTEFLNLAIKNKKIILKYKTFNNFWYEVDNKKDLELLKKEIKNLI